MPWSNGVFTRVHNWVGDRDAQIKIKADRHDAEDDNLATGLNLALLKDGTNAATANLNLGNKKITGLANGTAATDAVAFGQLSAAGVAEDDVMLLDGTNIMTAPLQMGAQKITNLAAGVAASDAVTVSQLTSASDGVASNLVMLLSGTQSMGAALQMGTQKITGLANGTAATDAATFGQLPTAPDVFADDVMLLDGTNPMTAALQMGTQKITGLANGTAATDAATFGQLPTAPNVFADDVMLLDGTNIMTANLVMNSNKITGLTTGTAATDAANVGQLPAITNTAARPSGLLEGGLWVKTVDATEWQLLMKHGAVDINISTINIEDDVNGTLDSMSSSIESLENGILLRKITTKVIKTQSITSVGAAVIVGGAGGFEISTTVVSATSSFIVEVEWMGDCNTADITGFGIWVATTGNYADTQTFEGGSGDGFISTVPEGSSGSFRLITAHIKAAHTHGLAVGTAVKYALIAHTHSGSILSLYTNRSSAGTGVSNPTGLSLMTLTEVEL
jgi:hypothetical protein